MFRFDKFLLERATGRMALWLLLLAVGSFTVLAAILTPAFQAATDGLRPFDLNMGLSAEAMYQDLPRYTDRSRDIYLWFAVVDYVYPAAAAAFFATLWAWLLKGTPYRWFRRLSGPGILSIPFLFMLADWLENAGFLIVVFGYPQEYRGIATAAGTLKSIKPMIEAVVVVLTLVFAAGAARAAWRRRQSTVSRPAA